MEDRIITVLGGTGFLGWRIVQSLARRGCTVRLAARHPERHSGTTLSDVRPMIVDVRDGPAVVRAIEGAAAVASVTSTLMPPGASLRPCGSTEWPG